MNKRQREAAERVMLKHILDTNPKLKETVDNLIDNPNPELNDIVAGVINQKLTESQMRGIFIGWYAMAMSAIEHCKNMESAEDIKKYLESERNKAKEKLGL